MKLSKAAKAVLFCVIAALLYGNLYSVLSWKDTGGDYKSTMTTFYTLDDDMVDVVFLGSSHCYCAVNTAILWEDYGIAAYSMAISGQDMASSYYCLKELLKTQKPKVVCVEMFYSILEGYAVKGNLYRNLLGYEISGNFRDAVDSIAEEEEKKDILLKWPIIHTRYAELTKKDFQPTPVMEFYMGSETILSPGPNLGELPVYYGEERTAIPEDTEQWLRKIIELAKESDVKLCFFLAPYWADEGAQMKYRYVEALARENDIPYMNMLAKQQELKLDTARDFADEGHMNSYGAEKSTNFLGQFLTNYYELEDRRGEERYTLWNENLKLWKHQKQNQELKETADLGLYLDKLSRLEGYTAVIITKGEYLTGDIATLVEHLMNLGIGEAFFQREGAWVIADGVLEYESARENCFHHMEIGDSDVLLHGNDEVMHIIVDRQDYSMATQGIDIVLYDEVLEEIADVVGFQAGENYTCIR